MSGMVRRAPRVAAVRQKTNRRVCDVPGMSDNCQSIMTSLHAWQEVD